MSEDERLHPGHRSIRLRGRDYSAPRLYFVTICAQDKQCIFGKVVGARVDMSKLGQTVQECWVAIPHHFPQANLFELVIMPNHMHGILEIVRQAGAQHAAPLNSLAAKPRVEHGSLGAIVRSFKAAVSKRAREELRWAGEIWQRNYFERGLRDGKEFADASRYIAENPPQVGMRSRKPGSAPSSSDPGERGTACCAPTKTDTALNGTDRLTRPH